MSSLLFNEPPLVLSPSLAKILGVGEAIILQQMHYWLEKNKTANINFNDGYYWTFNSYEDWQEKSFSFWSIRSIRTYINNLENKKILIAANYNQFKRDRTKWYRIDYVALKNLENENLSLNVNINEQSDEDNCDDIEIVRSEDTKDTKDSEVKKISLVAEINTNLENNKVEKLSTTNPANTPNPPNPPKRIFDDSSDEMVIVKYFISRIKIVGEDIKVADTPPKLQNWCTIIDYMLRIDKRDKREICEVIKAALEDSFWQRNILSPKSLRDKFDRLKLLLKNANVKKINKNQDAVIIAKKEATSDYLKELRGY